MYVVNLNDKQYALQCIRYDGDLSDNALVTWRIVGENEVINIHVPIADIFKGDVFLTAHLSAYLNQTTAEKPRALKESENMFIQFCQTLGFAGKADTASIEAICMSLINTGVQENINQALIISARALALINNVTQNGGNWNGIEWHDGI